MTAIAADAQPFDHSRYDAILKRHVKAFRVDYASLKRDAEFPVYLDALSNANPRALGSRQEQIAFWINAYNAFTLKLIIDHYPVKSIADISALGKLTAFFGDSPWKREFFSVGGEKLSLDKIEHDILRGTFKEWRAHFALNCASISCPPLRNEAYVGHRLDAQLDEQARNFLNDALRNVIDLPSKTLYLSKIFDWYQDDFVKAAGSLQKFLARYVDDDLREKLLTETFKIEFLDYDWGLNEAK